jgi:glycosyltransferase involved in cell wall biosynthesis
MRVPVYQAPLVSHINLSKEFRGGERQMLVLMDPLQGRVNQRAIVRKNGRLHHQLLKLDGLTAVPVSSSPLLAFPALLKFDLVHVHEGRSVQAAAIARVVAKVPYLITRRVPRKPHRHWMTRKCYRLASEVTAVSNVVRDRMIEYDDSLTISTIHDYLPNLSADRNEAERLRTEADGRLIIGHVGALDDAHKGQRIIIESARELANSAPNIEFWLIGQGKDQDSLVEEAAGLANVRFIGWADNVADYYAAMDVFVFPSRFEALGSSILEAMSFGLPVVASKIDGIPEIVDDRYNGLLFESENSHDFSRKLLRVVTDSGLRQTLGENASRTAKRFSAENAADQYVEIYQRILKHDVQVA